MASKTTKPAAANDDVDDLFSSIRGDESKAKKLSTTNKVGKVPSKGKAGEKDPLADLESELASLNPTSRPHTPRLKEATAKRSTATPPLVDDRAPPAGRKSTDSARSLRASFTPSATSSELHESERRGTVEQVQQQQQQHQQEQPQQAGGGWWGGFSNLASGVMKQAEVAYKELQQNEEAKKWAEQVRGIKGIDVGALRNYGDELRHRALPTFTNILHTLAPPISSHERLLVHISHDLIGYPSLDPLVHEVFARIMSQVEGGDLLVVQRGQENSSRRSNDGSAGWKDGPWWRQSDSPRELGLVSGMIEGTKLCRAGADGHAADHFAANGGLEQAKIMATESASESNPVRTSDVFLSLQAISVDAEKTLFARTATAENEKQSSTVEEQEESDELICFAIFLLDPIHDIEFSTVSQSLPAKWARWLDAPSPLTPRSGEENMEPFDGGLPEDIQDIIDGGGVDPREWVAEWVEETLTLAVGVVAQRYVARRMGVGEGGLGRGKRRVEELIQDNAGEAARAGLI